MKPDSHTFAGIQSPIQILSIIVLVFCFLSSCRWYESEEVIKVKPQKTITTVADTMYLSSQVSNLTYLNGRYYLSDYYHGIISFSRDFDSVVTEEINSQLPVRQQCYMFSVSPDGTICVYRPKEGKFVCKKDSGVYDNIDTDRYSLSLPSRFVVSGDTVVCSVIKNKMTAVMFSGGKAARTCFPTTDGIDDIRKPYHSERLIISDRKNYFVIGKGLPLVEMYSSDFNPVSSYDLMDIKRINNTFEQQKTGEPNSYFVIVQDAYVSNGKIYLLIASKPGGKYRCNNVLVLKIANNKIEFDNLYELEGNIYTTLCVNEKGQVVTVNSKNTAIEVYEL